MRGICRVSKKSLLTLLSDRGYILSMNSRIYWKSLRGNTAEINRIAAAAGIKASYLRLVMLGHERPGATVVLGIERATGGVICRHTWELDAFPVNECVVICSRRTAAKGA